MTREEARKSLNEITDSLSKNNLLYILSICKAVQQGEEAVKEEKRTQKGRYCHEGV